MGLKQQMKQTLGMTMTPQLQQAIKILQMSVMELQQEVTQALVENPTLEEMEEGGESSPAEENAISVAGGEDNAPPEGQGSELDKFKEDFDWQSYIESASSNSSQMPSTRTMQSGELPNFEQILARPNTLYDHLMWQLRMATEDPKKLEIGEEIIGNLNDDGYLMVLVDELAQREKVDVAEIEAVLFMIQRFDPPGVAARDLQECLLVQAEQLKAGDLVEQIIEQHMPELENKNYPAIVKALNQPLERVVEACKAIHVLEPRPGRPYASGDPVYIVPDIYVLKVGKEYMVVLNEEGIPRLRLSKSYQEDITSGKLAGEAKNYVRDKLKNASWLIKSIMQRQRTIFRVTESILTHQREFFDKGPQHLKPMILRDIAEELSLHESTISRVTTNKYVHTPHGIFELKYFFNSGISRSDGEDMASESVKQRIKEMVAKEDAKNPLSDQQLAEMLADGKINIARRTVAKYREALGILPSNKRKKYF